MDDVNAEKKEEFPWFEKGTLPSFVYSYLSVVLRNLFAVVVLLFC